MKRFDYIKQRDAMDCGPACLAMVLQHHGQVNDLDAVRKDCALGKSGVSLLGISRAAEKRGLHSLGGRITFETLVNEAPLPCIAHWNQNHFENVARKTGSNYCVCH
ncbi:cysteine peptidase family C39 domain-containing protein [Porphyromonas somerae]|uniref:cysteine peptidase family C39 domain-containing protein n=1 Tax=Porphyromonas somerae TaxID=322095 RepID=UPI002A81CBEA|nr:cysteine peptidase family C39 domain-containing protein [Porphyromonas somerae]MDY3885097.1 cysteine peptidase family C39 domain-containing protein [Porphyromonas somerae]